MKLILRLLLISALFAVSLTSVIAQDDEARQQSGLPSYIGNRPGTNPGNGADARLSGVVEITGLPETADTTRLSVLVLSYGTVVARQNVKNKGAFSFTGVPRSGVTLVVELDKQQIGSYPVGTLTPPPMSNRKDIYLTWASVEKAADSKTGVISVRNSYARTEENQKAFEKAMATSKEKNGSNASKLLKQLLERDDKDFVAWTELGNLLFKEEKYPDAESSYNKAIALKSDFIPALVNLGKLQLSQKQFDSAVATLIRAVEAEPGSAEAHHYLGESYLQSKKGSKAVEHLNKALELAPKEKAEIHLRLAMLYNAAGLKDRAATEYKMFLEKLPDHPEKAKFEKYIAENPPK